jgi:hypothetical protein
MHAAAILTLTVLFTYLTGQIAMRRGYAVKTWYWVGALFGPFALIAAFLMPRSGERRRSLARESDKA